jgi:nucleoside-triphosphatase THEP1
MKELKITIAGQTGTGKSTMMLMFEKFLMEKGFTVELELENELLDYGSKEKFRKIMKENVTERELALIFGTKIILKQIQTAP